MLPFDAYVAGRKLDLAGTVYFSPGPRRNLMSEDILARGPNGSCRTTARALSWGARSGRRFEAGHGLPHRNIRGVLRQPGAEEHGVPAERPPLAGGTYLAFPRPGFSRKGRAAFLFAFFDAEVRRALGAYLRAAAGAPRLLFRRVHVQSLNIEQAFDILPNGEQDHCDGCPTRRSGGTRLVSACVFRRILGLRPCSCPRRGARGPDHGRRRYPGGKSAGTCGRSSVCGRKSIGTMTDGSRPRSGGTVLLPAAKEPGLGFSDALLLLARRDGVPVGRSMGIVNRRYNEAREGTTARFACLESGDDSKLSVRSSNGWRTGPGAWG